MSTRAFFVSFSLNEIIFKIGRWLCIIVSLRTTIWHIEYNEELMQTTGKARCETKTEEISFKSFEKRPENISLELAFTLEIVWTFISWGISSSIFSGHGEYYTHTHKRRAHAVSSNFDFSTFDNIKILWLNWHCFTSYKLTHSWLQSNSVTKSFSLTIYHSGLSALVYFLFHILILFLFELQLW